MAMLPSRSAPFPARRSRPIGAGVVGIALAATIGLGLAGCDGPPQRTELTVEERYPIAVEPRAVYLDLKLGPDGRPHWGEERAIRSFVAEWVDAGKGPLVIAADNASNAERTRHAVARVAGELSGNASRVTAARRRVASGGAVLAFQRLVAVQPECGAELASLSDAVNTRSGVLGCATRRNLAAMVADPADLVAPAIPGGHAFAARRGLVIEKWRKGESTPAQTPEGEAATADFISGILGGGGG